MFVLKKSLIIVISIFTMILLASCNTAKSGDEEVPQFLDVKLAVNPEKAKIHQPVQFEAKVTYGDKLVRDADEVDFEIWRANEENHEKVKVKHDHDGIYSLRKTFDQEGTYYIISHVTARDMHSMPKKEFIIGKPSKPESDSSSETEGM
ncbi:FixH family protein [Cytobacillus sp. Hz8]|uniref:FixH family protein n=1 Tax=Cytobacillus sp. Hz8 TaxID=3347168 RepID=UPI0035D5AD5C